MALDYGERRVGVAVTDPTGILAQPLETIECGPKRPSPLGRLQELVSELSVERIVVGLPLHMDGREGEQADRARAFGERVRERTGVEVEYLDERWTSREAERVLAPAGSSRARQKQRKSRVDPVAAALLLSTWLERQRN
jgi:putative Holliday junction resolvase